MSEAVYSARGSNVATNERGSGYGGLIYILITGIFAVVALSAMGLVSSSIRNKSYDMELSNIHMAQSIFAGQRVANCTVKDKVVHSGIRTGPTYEATFHCKGNGSNPVTGDFHADVTEKEFNSIQVGKPYEVKVIDWGKKPNMPKFSITAKS